MITGAPTAMTLRARQKLKTPEACTKFNDDLSTKLNDIVAKGMVPSFDDFDISQNVIPFEQFEAMIQIFMATGVRIERMRMFGLSTLDDNAMFLMADWLRSVNAENCPHEMHISDCALTADGFTAFMEAIESNECFPTKDPRSSRMCPIYVRLENNYIQPESVIQDKIKEGVMVEYQKNSGPLRGPMLSAPEAKVKILCNNVGKYSQRQGVPPAPENAPPPKPVWDRYAEEQTLGGKGGGMAGGAANVSWANPYQSAFQWGQQAVYQALPARGWGGMQQGQAWPQQQQYAAPQRVAPAAPQRVAPAAASWAQPQQQQGQFKPAGAYAAPAAKAHLQAPVIKPAGAFAGGKGATFAAQAQVRPQAFNAFNAGAGAKGGSIAQNMQRAPDRSRTPAGRATAPQAPPPQKKGNGLPAGWEEHFSEEYQIPYFWHGATGESMWEKPSA